MNGRILRLAVPAIVNNITVPLLGLCDTAVAGHLGAASYIGAISVGAMMLNVFFWLCGFLRMGTTGLTANAFGANSAPECRRVLLLSLRLALLISIPILIFQEPLLKLLILITSPGESVAGLSSEYFRICVWGVPAQLGIMAISGWFIGLQTTVVPMIIAIGVNVVNIGMSLLFVFLFHFGFSGIALGTLVANWVGLIVAGIWAIRAMKTLTFKDSPSSSTALSLKRFFSVNGNLFFRSACIMGVSMTMTSIGARLGDVTLAANAVMMQFFIFFSYFMDGFAFAGEALTGKAAGEHNLSLLHKVVAALLRWGAGVAMAFLLIYVFAAAPITGFLTDDVPVREAVASMRLWIIFLPPLTVAAFLFDGIFIGLTRTREMLYATLAATAVFAIILFLSRHFNAPSPNAWLWTAFETYLLLRGILLGLTYISKKKRMDSEI